MGLVRSILQHEPVPPTCYMKHELLTPENVNRLYPLDPGARLMPESARKRSAMRNGMIEPKRQ